MEDVKSPLVENIELLLSEGFRQGHLEGGVDPFAEPGIRNHSLHAFPGFFAMVQVGAEKVIGIEATIGEQGF